MVMDLLVTLRLFGSGWVLTSIRLMPQGFGSRIIKPRRLSLLQSKTLLETLTPPRFLICTAGLDYLLSHWLIGWVPVVVCLGLKVTRVRTSTLGKILHTLIRPVFTWVT